MRLNGIVESGTGKASYWLACFARVYEEWLGMPVFPGSLNLRLPQGFDWHDPGVAEQRRTFSLFPHGGERLIYMVPCEILLPNRCRAFLWSTTNAANEIRPVVEIIASVCLREQLHIENGSAVALTCPEPWPSAIHGTEQTPC